MNASMSGVQDRLERVIDEFSDLDGREKLELLLDYASSLPPLPAEYVAEKSQRRVHECQTPVYLWVKLGAAEGAAAGRRPVELIAEVAEEAPTVKGFVSVLAGAVAGRPADEVLAIREDFLDRLGLGAVLGIMRSRGLRAIVEHVKRSVVSAMESAAAAG